MRKMSLPLALAAGLQISATAAARPVVVELFTSEGCSSCPPADILLTELSARHDVLPLAFHVTYWNSLGWRDPFSTEAATDRQARYAAQLGGGSYTPEIVVDGQRGMVGSDRDEVVAAISTARNAAGRTPDVRVSRANGQLKITIAAGGPQGRILLIGYDRRHQTAIGRGENSGRTLTESNIVRSLRDIGSYAGSVLDLSVPPGAGETFAVLIQAPNGRIVGTGAL